MAPNSQLEITCPNTLTNSNVAADSETVNCSPNPIPTPIPSTRSTGAGSKSWIVAADGGVFSFHAPFFGSTGGIRLAQPVVGMVATPDGGGYWLVARDGGIFTFGNAAFFGSTGGIHLVRPIVGMAGW
jgi:hypothetical protein